MVSVPGTIGAIAWVWRGLTRSRLLRQMSILLSLLYAMFDFQAIRPSSCRS